MNTSNYTRFDLREYVDQLTRNNIEFEKTALLEYDWTDTLTAYYFDEILKRYQEYAGITVDIESFREYLAFNQEDYLVYVEASSPCATQNLFVITGLGEIEIELPDRLKRRNPEVINRNTDIYISNGYGYINCSYDFVAVDFDKIDMEDIQ